MSSLSGIRRGFQFGQSRTSWCTRCNGANCKEDVGFLSDSRGTVQGYLIDSKNLGEATAKKYTRENRRKNDSPPGDGIYKRPLDVKKLLNRNPANVNTVKFSSDVLKLLLVGVEGCDDFVRGKRDFSKANGCINLNMIAAEVLNGERIIEGIKVVKGSR